MNHSVSMYMIVIMVVGNNCCRGNSLLCCDQYLLVFILSKHSFNPILDYCYIETRSKGYCTINNDMTLGKLAGKRKNLIHVTYLQVSFLKCSCSFPCGSLMHHKKGQGSLGPFGTGFVLVELFSTSSDSFNPS